ncbi:mannosyl-oligosaccharide glucosidase-like [Babylonia areolata]|uniref:mannosyl-oligosaccharide glucosidase-like n=1 Tax=Babylonia areolata TaxID=304850 RepID=UPI003FD4714C
MECDEDGVRRRIQPHQSTKRKLLPHEEPDDPNWPYAHGNLDPLGKFVGLCIMTVSLSLVAYFRYQQYLRDIVITPLDAPAIIAANATSPSISPDRFWGTYRPQTYFGLKTRSPNSPLFGSMWLEQFTNRTPLPLRHWCDQADGLHGYSWLLHDGKSFGIQELEDKAFMVKTEFVKRAGGHHGGDWTTRITMMPKSADKEIVVSSMFYVALEGHGSVQPIFTEDVMTGISGHTQDLGAFQLRFPATRSKSQKASHFITHASNLSQLTDVVKAAMKEKMWSKGDNLSFWTLGSQQMLQDARGINFIVKEVTAVLPMEMEVVFESGSFSNRPDRLAGDVFKFALGKHVDDFNQQFSDIFRLEQKGFRETEVHMAKAALSNMLGSVSYFYGSPSLVLSQYNKVPVKYWKAPLFSSVSSRSVSLCGSLWEEGFHNLLISRWDEGLSMEIMGHWLDLINTEGWIPIKQALADEAYTEAKTHCVIQHNSMAAPPTIFLPLQKLVPKLVNSKDPSVQQYLVALYPRLKALYAWYNSSHAGSKMSTYRWRGLDHTTVTGIVHLMFASGLHDYPQASQPTEKERHLDLRCWMALASGVMAEMAKSLNKEWQQYTTTHQFLTDNALLDSLHWSEEGQQYSDYGLHTETGELEKTEVPSHLQSGQPVSDLLRLRVSSPEPKYQFLNAFGYVSLFPLLLKIIDAQSPKLYKMLTDLKDPALLWSPYGLRSLAHTSHLHSQTTTEHDSASCVGMFGSA